MTQIYSKNVLLNYHDHKITNVINVFSYFMCITVYDNIDLVLFNC